MEYVEKGINEVQEHMKESIQRHNEIFAKTIYNTAKKSKQCSTSLDRGFQKTFPDSNTLGVESPDPFNPKAVFEFKQGVATDVIETWDHSLGILPDRKVMGNYYIDLSNSLTIKDNPNKWLFIHPNPANNSGSGDVNIYNSGSSTFSGNSFIKGGHQHVQYYKIHINGTDTGHSFTNGADGLYRCFPLNNPIVKRGEERKFENYTEHHEFEVDNYLNLYHKPTGLYLMLHKTTFPDISFYLAKQFTQLNGKPYYKIYESKRVDKLSFSLQNNYLSKDNRKTLLSTINTLLPDNYKHVFELYNNFRKLQPLLPVEEVSIEEDIPDESIDVTDSKDRVIEGLKTKLNETIKRSEKNETLISEMIEQYNAKSTDFLESERNKQLIQSKLTEMKLLLETKDKKLKCEIEKVKQEYEIRITEIKESKDRDKFDVYRRLSEAEVFRAKSESLGISYNSLKTSLERETLEKKKIKDMNRGLLSQFEQQRERNNKLSNDNSSLLKQLDEKVYLADECRRIMDELNQKLDKKEKECTTLTNQLSDIGETTDSALENALSDRVSDLEAEIVDLKREKNEKTNENKKLKLDLEKIRGFMSAF
jgi:hypothetical protein